MATPRDIQNFHMDIKRRIAELIGLRGATIASSHEEWNRLSAGARILFEMYPGNNGTFAERQKGGRCPVFPLKASLADEENQAWAGWHEEWLCVKSRQYGLVGAGWTFFWGILGRLTKEQQIFRAEWDEAEHRGRLAPQPHWHMDTNIMVGYTPTPSSRRSADIDGLVELPSIPDCKSALCEISPPEGLQEISLGGMHLGMGGWSNHSNHPQWWQRHVGENWTALAEWAERTLRLAMDQLNELRVKDRAE
jgi:hypothetical protein